MINIGIDNANPELVAKVEARTKELGFTTVSDYLTHLVLSSETPRKPRNTKIGKGNKPTPNSVEVQPTLLEVAGMMNDLEKSFLGYSVSKVYSFQEIYNAMRRKYPIVKTSWGMLKETYRDDLAIQFKNLVENSMHSSFEKVSGESSGGYSKYKYIREESDTRLTSEGSIITLDESSITELVSNLNEMGYHHFKELLHQLYSMETIYKTYATSYPHTRLYPYAQTLPKWEFLSDSTKSLIEEKFKEIIEDTDSNFDISNANQGGKPLYKCERDDG